MPRKYVESTLAKNETIAYEAKFHWTYTLNIVMCLFVGIPLFLTILIDSSQMLVLWGFGSLLTFAGILMWITKRTTEIVITSSRVVYKTGLIARTTNEIALTRIEGVNLKQGVTGRILGYGKVSCRGTGIGSLTTPIIDDPMQFRSAIQQGKGVEV